MERFLRIFWLLLIPTQLGKHFWLKESSVLGVRIDYLSLILYLTDVVWLGWVGYKIWTTKQKGLIKDLLNWKSLLLIGLAIINVILTEAKWVAIYRWLRIGQWWLSWKLISENKETIRDDLKKIIPVWILLESFLGLAQMVKGGSLNGIWWWLGERRFSYTSIGIAQMRIFDEGWIRAYGTFSHPNSLAGFLLLAWSWYKANWKGKRGVYYWVVWWSAILGIVITGSRTVWLVTIIMLMVELIKKWKEQSKRQIIGKILLGGGVICLILGVISIDYRISDFLGGWDINSWEKRETLNLIAGEMIKSNPLFGIGAGNFVSRIPEFRVGNFYWMQPVHNVLLLIWSEIGTIGLIVLGIIGGKFILKIGNKKYWWIWLIVGITGMLDHYWLTLPQNTWLLAVIFGLI